MLLVLIILFFFASTAILIGMAIIFRWEKRAGHYLDILYYLTAATGAILLFQSNEFERASAAKDYETLQLTQRVDYLENHALEDAAQLAIRSVALKHALDGLTPVFLQVPENCVVDYERLSIEACYGVRALKKSVQNEILKWSQVEIVAADSNLWRSSAFIDAIHATADVAEYVYKIADRTDFLDRKLFSHQGKAWKEMSFFIWSETSAAYQRGPAILKDFDSIDSVRAELDSKRASTIPPRRTPVLRVRYFMQSYWVLFILFAIALKLAKLWIDRPKAPAA